MAAPDPNSLRPFTPGSAGAWDTHAAAHLLERAGFGGTREEIQSLARLDYQAALNHVMDGAKEPYNPPAPTWVAEAEEARGLNLGSLSQEEREAHRRRNRERLEDLRKWWVRRMVASPRGLEEKLVLFWHGHFATSAEKVQETLWLYDQLALFRSHGMRSFPDLMIQVACDPAMIRLLDSESNRKGRPNENFARELMELYTMGEGNYSERDVQESARAFTGYGLENGRFHFHRSRHDAGRKTVLGETGNFNGEDVIRRIMQTDAAARYVPQKLFEFFVYPDPPESVVEELARQFRASQHHLGALLHTIFRSEAFFSAKARHAIVKSPAQFVIGSLRKLGTALPPEQAYLAMKRMGQDLLWPPNVDGWEEGRAWVHTNALMMRYHFGYYLATGAVPEGLKLGRGSMATREPWIRVRSFCPPETHRNPGACVDIASEMLFGRRLPTARRREYTDFVQRASNGARVQFNLSTPTSRERLRTAMYLMMSSPEYQLC